MYTAHIIAEMIKILEMFPALDTGLLFGSDHGESLGENGIFLHGMSYAIAPQGQTCVPMILWLSNALQQSMQFDLSALKQLTQNHTYSHDYLFHSLLGLFRI